MKKLLLTTTLLFAFSFLHAQTDNVGIGSTPDPLAKLDISATDAGLLIPRVDTASINAASAGLTIPTGLLIFDPTETSFYYWNSTNWKKLEDQSLLIDDDSDTNISLIELDQDIIDINLEGTNHIRLRKNITGTFFIDVPNNNGNLAIGNLALVSNNLGSNNLAIGKEAMLSSTSAESNIAIGTGALYNSNGTDNISIGRNNNQDNINGNENVSIGSAALINNISGSGNVALGHAAGLNELGSNKLYIENSIADSSAALIYGEFDNDILRVNGALQVNDPAGGNGYILPTTRGNDGYILQANADSTTSWVQNFKGILIDDDGDTGIQTNEGAIDDMIFVIDNSISMQMLKTGIGTFRIEIPNNSENIAIGAKTLSVNSAANNIALGFETLEENTIGTDNVATGYRAMTSNTDGDFNLASGSLALRSNISGSENVAVGYESGYLATGSDNVFLGSQAGYNETGDQKLYIENSNADQNSALIYGEFDNDKLRLNAEVSINGDYTLPKSGGPEGSVMMMLSNGEAIWDSVSLVDQDPTNELVQVFATSADAIALGDAGGFYPIDLKITKLTDSDENTKIVLDKDYNNDDKIRFDIAGTEKMIIQQNASAELQISIPTIFRNIFIGDEAGDANAPAAIFGQDNVFVGNNAGMSNTQGRSNTFLGSSTGSAVTTGLQNTFVGTFAGQNNTGSTNTFLGNSAGLENVGGSGNVFIGNKAGHMETGSNRLYISNDKVNQDTALIYGEFDNKKVRINGNLGIGTDPLQPIHINQDNSRIKQANLLNSGVITSATDQFWQLRLSATSNAESLGIDMTEETLEPYETDTLTLGTATYKWKEIYATNATINTSDRRFKKNIRDISYGLGTVMQMRPVSYQWKKEANGRTINGFIAQEMEEVVPEVVEISQAQVNPNKPGTESEYDELYGMRYTELIPVLTKAIQDQQSIIQALTERVEALEARKN